MIMNNEHLRTKLYTNLVGYVKYSSPIWAMWDELWDRSSGAKAHIHDTLRRGEHVYK